MRSFTNKKKKSTLAVRRVLEDKEDLSNPMELMSITMRQPSFPKHRV
jgi:hypothetical protein